MTVDRGEAQGTAIALLLHVALVVALTMNLASPPRTPEPPPMTVELVESDEVALTAAATQQAVTPPAAQAPAPGEITPAPPEPQPSLAPPPPQPIVRPAPTPPLVSRPSSAARPAAQRAAPQRQTSPTSSRNSSPASRTPTQRAPGLANLLDGVPDAPASASRVPARQGAATFSTQAQASVTQAILRQIQPCADRQPALGPGASRLRVVLNLRLERSGRLSRPPQLIDVRGVDDENGAFEDLAYNQAVAVFRACSPLRLPADLYSTPQGGWGNITMTYRAK